MKLIPSDIPIVYWVLPIVVVAGENHHLLATLLRCLSDSLERDAKIICLLQR